MYTVKFPDCTWEPVKFTGNPSPTSSPVSWSLAQFSRFSGFRLARLSHRASTRIRASRIRATRYTAWGTFLCCRRFFLPLGLLHLQGGLGPLLPFLPGRLLRGLGLLPFRGLRSGTGPAPAVVLQADDLPLFRRLMFAALRHGALSFPGPLSKRPD